MTFYSSIPATTPHERARLGAELQHLYAEGKHAEILATIEASCLKTKQDALNELLMP